MDQVTVEPAVGPVTPTPASFWAAAAWRVDRPAIVRRVREDGWKSWPTIEVGGDLDACPRSLREIAIASLALLNPMDQDGRTPASEERFEAMEAAGAERVGWGA